MTDDEYFKKLNPVTEAIDTRRTGVTHTNEEVIPGGDSLGTHILQGDVARAPTLIHRQVRVQSNQGILNQFGDELPSSPIGEYDTEYDSSASSPNPMESSPATERTSEIQAVPIFAIQHARQGSRGSARLLDIPARKDSLRSSIVLSNRTSAIKPDTMNDEGSNRSSTVGMDAPQSSNTIMEHDPHESTNNV